MTNFQSSMDAVEGGWGQAGAAGVEGGEGEAGSVGRHPSTSLFRSMAGMMLMISEEAAALHRFSFRVPVPVSVLK
jgi:hypothetical protein